MPFAFAVIALAGALSQSAAAQRVCVRDSAGNPIVNATVTREPAQVKTAADGCAVVPDDAAGSVTVSADGFAAKVIELSADGTAIVAQLQPVAHERVEVTSTRTPLPLDASASSVVILGQQQLQTAPGVMLDDKLRQVDGFQLFRRTSSTVANPTNQGTSLRGLGSTAASRTLVLNDQVPLNDAFGGWVHWDEIPELAVTNVDLLRGGASDLYGSSAIGGVIDVVTAQPSKLDYAADVFGGGEGTTNESGLLTAQDGKLGVLGAATIFRTDGYILTAPEARGDVDVPSNLHSQSGRLELRRAVGEDGDAFLRGNVLNEARDNGTPDQTNGTRLWRYLAGADEDVSGGRLLLRLHGNTQAYRQSFSAIAADRNSENLTRLQAVRDEQLGGVAQYSHPVRRFTFVAGADALDTRATDTETPVTQGVLQPATATSARQRDTGVYGEGLWDAGRGWFAALSARYDHFQTFDAHSVLADTLTPLPETNENILSLRLGVVKRISRVVSANASVFRAFRGPTMNELYRTGQVGSQTTKPNPSLVSERATGFEFGALLESSKASLRASYFWTEVNRPVAAVTLSSTPTSTLLMRENLGQIRSRGTTIEGEYRPAREFTLTAGYQLAIATVTQFQADPTLVGNWTPQVPRNSATAKALWSRPRFGTYSLELITSGRQYDDQANMYELHAYTSVGLYAEHGLWRRLSAYAQVQNLLDRRIEAGRTPTLTLGQPQLLLVGVRLGRAAR